MSTAPHFIAKLLFSFIPRFLKVATGLWLLPLPSADFPSSPFDGYPSPILRNRGLLFSPDRSNCIQRQRATGGEERPLSCGVLFPSKGLFRSGGQSSALSFSLVPFFFVDSVVAAMFFLPPCFVFSPDDSTIDLRLLCLSFPSPGRTTPPRIQLGHDLWPPDVHDFL